MRAKVSKIGITAKNKMRKLRKLNLQIRSRITEVTFKLFELSFSPNEQEMLSNLKKKRKYRQSCRFW